MRTPPPPRPKVDHTDDVTHLLRAGESPEVIAARLGLKPASVARSLRRYGMPEVARPFDRVAKADRPSRARSAAA